MPGGGFYESEVFLTQNPGSDYATVTQVWTDFTAGCENSLYILSRNKETEKVKIMKDIS